MKTIAGFDYGDGKERWYALGSNPVHEKILEIARHHFDLNGVSGYEMWRNSNNPGRHVDKDEVLYREEKRLVMPQCSAVYYPLVDNMLGGEFYTDDIRYFPRTNRLVLFSLGIEHGVSAYNRDSSGRQHQPLAPAPAQSMIGGRRPRRQFLEQGVIFSADTARELALSAQEAEFVATFAGINIDEQFAQDRGHACEYGCYRNHQFALAFAEKSC